MLDLAKLECCIQLFSIVWPGLYSLSEWFEIHVFLVVTATHSFALLQIKWKTNLTKQSNNTRFQNTMKSCADDPI